MTKNIFLLIIGSILLLSSCKSSQKLADTTFNEEEYMDDTNDDVYAEVPVEEPVAEETTIYEGDDSAKWEEEPVEDTPVEEVEPETIPEPVAEPEPEPIKTRDEDVSMVQGVEQKPFCIILGSFAKQNNAINFRNRLMSEGYSECSIYRNEAGLYRVSAVGFDKQWQACRELAKIRTEYPEFGDSWLLRKK